MPEVEALHAKEARVQALATLFDEGTEDAQVNPNPLTLPLLDFLIRISQDSLVLRLLRPLRKPSPFLLELLLETLDTCANPKHNPKPNPVHSFCCVCL